MTIVRITRVPSFARETAGDCILNIELPLSGEPTDAGYPVERDLLLNALAAKGVVGSDTFWYKTPAKFRKMYTLFIPKDCAVLVE